MNAGELRIGNWISHQGIEFEVLGLDMEYVLLKSNINKFHSFEVKHKLIKPIPITEEWLIKFGFVQASEFKQHYLLECEFGELEYAFFDASNSLWIDGVWIKNINYVHQLQNIHFDLTQTQLQIK